MTNRKPASARFAILFILGILLASAAIFVAFSRSQRSAMEWRRGVSAKNLAAIHGALKTYAQKNGAFPERPSQLLASKIIDTSMPEQAKTLLNPSWPLQPGYMYIPGVRLDDDGGTLLVYENVPENKRKLGRQVACLSGKIELLSEAEFDAKLKAQEESWRKSNRALKGMELVAPETP